MLLRTAVSAALASALMLAAASPAVAGAKKTMRVTQVSYDDLDLSTKKGERTLMDRVRHAATRVCYVSGARDPATMREFSDCHNAVFKAAKAEAKAVIEAARAGQALASGGAAGVITVRQAVSG